MVAHHVAAQAGFRRRVFRQLEPSARGEPGLSPVNAVVITIVVFSFVVFALETETSLSRETHRWLQIANLSVLVAFAVEYVLRLWVEGEDPRYRGVMGRLRYAVTPIALADLIAFLPELLWVLFAREGDETVLMLLRILRLVRLVKIARCVPAFGALGAAMRRASGQLLTALSMALALIFVSAVLLYFVEGVGHGSEAFASIPRALWWAMATLTTVGYGDVYPMTVPGRVAASVIAVAGIGVVALPAGIFASAFSDELRSREAARRQAAAQASSEAGPTSGA